MNKKEIQNTLDYCDVAYEELSVGQEQSILITQHGGHIFGPFSDRYPEGLFWIPDSMQDRNRYQELIDKKIWNIGGRPRLDRARKSSLISGIATATGNLWTRRKPSIRAASP